jgi:cytosine/adenosine deaminase-related metal-dependent hydrolase
VINVRANAALGLPLPPVAKLLDAGVTLLLGTDNGILNGPDLFRELDAVYRLVCSQAGESSRPNPWDILKMVTANVAHTRWGKEWPGQLEVGMPSTFILLDMSAPHFQHSLEPTATLMTRANPSDVLLTVQHGNVIYQRPDCR